MFHLKYKKEVYLFHHHLINRLIHPLPVQKPEAVTFCQNLIQAFKPHTTHNTKNVLWLCSALDLLTVYCSRMTEISHPFLEVEVALLLCAHIFMCFHPLISSHAQCKVPLWAIKFLLWHAAKDYSLQTITVVSLGTCKSKQTRRAC